LSSRKYSKWSRKNTAVPNINFKNNKIKKNEEVNLVNGGDCKVFCRRNEKEKFTILPLTTHPKYNGYG